MNLDDIEVEINIEGNREPYREITEHYNVGDMSLEEKAEFMKQLILDKGDKIQRIEATPSKITLELIETE